MHTVARPGARTTLRHPNRRRARGETFDWLAAQFTHITPAEMRAAERAVTGSSPVADRMAVR